MGALDQVMAMKSRGTSDSEIIRSLREQGVSPREINDALGQARIKSAVSSESMGDGMEPSILRPERAEELPTEGSISDEDLTPLPSGNPAIMQQMARIPLHQEESEEEYVPRPGGEQYGNQYGYQQQQSQQEYMPQEMSYGGDEGQGSYPQGQMATDTDTIIEISEQVFAERMKGAVKQIESFNEFRVLAQSKIDTMSERLKRIESTIDQLQISILEKIGSYGRGIDSVKKEMEMMQDSFGKMVKGSAERAQSHQHHQAHHQEHSQQHNQTHSSSTPTTHRIEKKTTVVHKSGKMHSKK